MKKNIRKIKQELRNFSLSDFAMRRRWLSRGHRNFSEDDDEKATIDDLTAAILDYDSDEVERLIKEEGVDPNEADSEGYTPIGLAIEMGDSERIGQLVELGADINARDYVDYALEYAECESGGHEDFNVILADEIISYGGKPTGATLISAIKFVDENKEEAVDMLLHCKVDPNFKDSDGGTPLMAAIKEGDLTIAKLLVEAGADVDERDIELAEKDGHTKIASFLKKCGDGKGRRGKHFSASPYRKRFHTALPQVRRFSSEIDNFAKNPSGKSSEVNTLEGKCEIINRNLFGDDMSEWKSPEDLLKLLSIIEDRANSWDVGHTCRHLADIINYFMDNSNKRPRSLAVYEPSEWLAYNDDGVLFRRRTTINALANARKKVEYLPAEYKWKQAVLDICDKLSPDDVCVSYLAFVPGWDHYLGDAGKDRDTVFCIKVQSDNTEDAHDALRIICGQLPDNIRQYSEQSEGSHSFITCRVSSDSTLEANNKLGEALFNNKGVDYKKAEEAISEGADVNISCKHCYKDYSGVDVKIERLPLIWAAQKTDTELVKFLLDNGADANIVDSNGCTPLMYAVNRSNWKEAVEKTLATMKLLLEHGADINAQDDDGNTALIIATLENNKYIVRFLIKNGADVQIENKEHRTARGLVSGCFYRDVMSILNKAGGRRFH